MIATLSRSTPVRTVVGASAILLVVAALSGCGDGYPTDMAYGVRTDPIVDPNNLPKSTPPNFGPPGQWPFLQPSFSKEGKLLETSKLTSQQRGQFDKTLTELFGTPAAPKVAPIEGVEEQSLKDLQLVKDGAVDPLAEGSRHYRRHCLHCHGLTGDGHGPTAAWVNPHPRDYRPGVFKFTSSGQSLGIRKPRREDLLRVLSQGIEGTSMPSFGLLPKEELQHLASYVIHLSLRGQTEYNALRIFMGEDLNFIKRNSASDLKEIDTTLREQLPTLVTYWTGAEKEQIVPTAQPSLLPATVQVATKAELDASVARGHKLFLGAVPGGSSCISCHSNYGRTPYLRYDTWGTVVRPTDLTTGIYRGGRRPIDLFWRIHSGINGVGMPEYPPGAQKDQDIWDVINFVLALPYPDMLPKEVRDEIYPPAPVKAVTASRE